MKDGKKKVWLAVVVIVFFLLGNLTAFIFLRQGEITPTRTGFKNPTGAPFIEGPSGPPPHSAVQDPSPRTR